MMLHCDGRQWLRDDNASAASGGNDLSALWMDEKEQKGWAIGASGVVLHYDGKRWMKPLFYPGLLPQGQIRTVVKT